MSDEGKKAVVLLSGGLDSATTLFVARDKGYRTYGLIFDYGQRHRKEIRQAVAFAQAADSAYQIVKIGLPWKGSALLDRGVDIPDGKPGKTGEIPVTYVPARNIIFLSFAVSYAEAVRARAVFIGANAVDYSGYPDCRPEFFEAYQKAVQSGTKTGVKGRPVKIYAPLIRMSKARIIRLGTRLGVPYAWTWSCYRGGKRPCGRCDSCRLRQKGFDEAGLCDPLLKEDHGR